MFLKTIAFCSWTNSHNPFRNFWSIFIHRSGIYAEKWFPEKRHVPYRFIWKCPLGYPHELLCIIPKVAFVLCCFFKFYFTQVCWYKRYDSTSWHFLQLVKEKGITNCIKAAVCIISFVQLAPKYPIPKINMLNNLSCCETRFRLLCHWYLSHSSLNLVFEQHKLHNICIFGMAYWCLVFGRFSQIFKTRFSVQTLIFPPNINQIKVVDSCWISSTEWSHILRSFFAYGKKQESRRKIYHNRGKNFTFFGRFDRKNTVLGISRNLIDKLVFKWL